MIHIHKCNNQIYNIHVPYTYLNSKNLNISWHAHSEYFRFIKFSKMKEVDIIKTE